MKVGDVIEYKDEDDYLLGEVLSINYGDYYQYYIIKIYKCINNSGLMYPEKRYRIDEKSIISLCCKILGTVYDDDIKEKIMAKCL